MYITLLITLSIVFFVLLICFIFYPWKHKSKKEMIIINKFLGDPTSAETNKLKNYAGTLTYAMPIKINEWNYPISLGRDKREIFTHGKSSYDKFSEKEDILSISMSELKNDLFIKVRTRTERSNKTEEYEEIHIEYVPVGKYFHIILVLSQMNIDVYIDGNLYKSHTFQNKRNILVSESSLFKWKNGNLKPNITTGEKKGKFVCVLGDLSIPELRKIYKRDKINDNDGKKFFPISNSVTDMNEFDKEKYISQLKTIYYNKFSKKCSTQNDNDYDYNKDLTSVNDGIQKEKEKSYLLNNFS